jgi:hypothetical protein
MPTQVGTHTSQGPYHVWLLIRLDFADANFRCEVTARISEVVGLDETEFRIRQGDHLSPTATPPTETPPP